MLNQPHYYNGSTHFPEHPTRLPISTTAANKRAEFKASRRFAIEASLSPKTSLQHNEYLDVPDNGYLRHQKPINGYSYDHRTTTFSPLPSIVIDDLVMGLNSQMQTPKSTIITVVDASTETTDPDTYKKNPIQRIFVSRSLQLEKIKFFGFDLDYTICNYKSPEFESLLFERIISRLIDIGYPESLRTLKYNNKFAIRGLWYDLIYGNLVKADAHGNILTCTHGFKFLKPIEIEECYPNRFLNLNNVRVIALNTLFDLSVTYLLASLIDFFDNSDEFQINADKTSVRAKNSDTIISYKSIGQDVECSANWVHTEGSMKRHILENLDTFVEKDERITLLLKQLRANGKRTFILTNSEFFYTNGVLNYLIGPDWPKYFDATIVDAKKPLWFVDGTVFREVDVKTGVLKLGVHVGPLKAGKVFAGGSCESFCRLMNARGKDVLYVGDHIFGDVLRSKKSRGWRTFLIVPELEHELKNWTAHYGLFEKLNELDLQLVNLYRNMDASSSNKIQQDILEVVKAIRNKTHEMDQTYGILGSLFRSGSQISFFASQVERYADLYSSSPYNLLYYPGFYFFRAPIMHLPHEFTIDNSSNIGPQSDVEQKLDQNYVENGSDSLSNIEENNLSINDSSSQTSHE